MIQHLYDGSIMKLFERSALLKICSHNERRLSDGNKHVLKITNVEGILSLGGHQATYL